MRAEFADVLERFASGVMALRGVSRTNPHRFAEDKDALAKAMVAEAREYRLSMATTAAIAARSATNAQVAAIRTGSRRIGGREVPVELRRRRA